ncbi:MAG: exo-alpha-sialidase [bacterium]|nr:exo-alpha-sialidase [bacterium]
MTSRNTIRTFWVGLGLVAVVCAAGLWLLGESQPNERTAIKETSLAGRPPRRMDPADVDVPYRRWSPLDDVGTNHRCNQDTTNRAQNECPIAADPTNPDILLVGANDYALGSNSGTRFYSSTDGGSSWRQSLIGSGAVNGNCTSIFDPVVTINSSGRMFAAYLAMGCDYPNDGAYLHYSDDHGVTWSPPTTISTVPQINSQIDREMIACDVSDDSPYRDNIYVTWIGFHVHFTRSTDNGESFMTPLVISSQADAIMPTLATGPLGEVYVVWTDLSSEDLQFRKSLDGGITWQPMITIGECNPQLVYHDLNCNSGYRMTNYPVPAVDISDGPHRGAIYVAYAHTIVEDNYDIYFTKSEDQGATWSEPVILPDDDTGSHQWWPWIAVHPRTGDVAVSWCDRREDPANCDYAYYGTISTDGGATWSANMRISDRQLDTHNRGFLGDYTGLTFSNLGFHSAWTDTRNDYSDIYAAWWNNGDSLALTSPNGGETWNANSACMARWTLRYAPDTLLVELNRSYPAGVWERLDTIRSDEHEWSWNATGPGTSAARLRIVGLNHPDVGDTSDADFAINALAAPARLTAYRIGTSIQLRWQSTGAPWYHVYSALSTHDSFTTLEGVTVNTTLLDTNAVLDAEQKYYIVRAALAP